MESVSPEISPSNHTPPSSAMSQLNTCGHGGVRNVEQAENLTQAFECGKLWELLHQNVSLLRLWGFSVSKENVAANCKLDWLDANFADEAEPRASTASDWTVEWNDVAMDHLLDATDLFSLVLSDDQRKPVVIKKLRYGPDHLIKLNLLQQCLEVVSKLAHKYELDNATKGHIAAHLDDLASKKSQLKEGFCSPACKADFAQHAWTTLISEFLESMISFHVRLLQGRAVQTSEE